MKTENNQENLESGRPQPKTRDGAVGDDKSKSADSTQEQAANARNGAVGDDLSKGANATQETPRPKDGAVGDDRSKGLGDLNDPLKG